MKLACAVMAGIAWKWRVNPVVLCVLVNTAAAGQAICLQKSTAIGKKLFTAPHGMFHMRAFRCFSFKIPRALDDMCLQRHLFAKHRNTIKGDVNNLCTIGEYPRDHIREGVRVQSLLGFGGAAQSSVAVQGFRIPESGRISVWGFTISRLTPAPVRGFADHRSSDC